MEFSADELEIRQPLWIALSDLYLDTEPDWKRVAAICADSSFALHELKRILFDEVHPIVHWNLWSSAGVWDGFDRDWLIESIRSRRRKPIFRLPWPAERRYPWRELKPHIVLARQQSGSAP